MLPSRPVDWITPRPVVEKVTYPTRTGEAQGEVYRPSTGGPHPAIVLTLGVVPFGVDHPQVPIAGRALARAGFVVLIYWSPAMRDFRLDPDDVENLALAYDWLIQQPYVDPARSGLVGTCVGGSFALMASASPLIREKVRFACAYAPYSSMWTFARDIASSTRLGKAGREPWHVDPLTRKVFVHSLTAWLEPAEAEQLRNAFAEGTSPFDARGLSDDGRAVYSLLTARSPEAAVTALGRLPASMQARLAALSPVNYLKEVRAPLLVFLHDAGDPVIPVSESRRLMSALATRGGVHYTEMYFQHLDPVKGRLPLPLLLREIGKMFLAMCPIFEQAVDS